MLTRNRLLALKQWMEDTVCKGRVLKAPDPRGDITKIRETEPKVYLGFWPTRPETGYQETENLASICPAILIAPNTANVKCVEEKRFDTYNGVHRPQAFGQWLNVSILFVTYEPGIRLPGFLKEDGKVDFTRMMEGSEQGLFTLMDWIDDCNAALIAQGTIPNSDLIVNDVSMEYGPYIQSDYIADKRPLFYGFINVKFQCFANDKNNSSIDQYLN